MLCQVAILNTISQDFVFKGALLLNAIGNNSNELYRATSDIDFDFTKTTVTQSELDSLIEVSCKMLINNGYNVYANCYRQFGNGKSAGYSILCGGVELYHIDVSVRKQNSNVTMSLNGVPVKCATVEKMLCDKLSAISTKTVNRRVKDVYDIYYMSSVFSFTYNNIVSTFKRDDRILGDFKTFLSAYDNLKHAYILYKGIYDKKDFDIIYAQVKEFCLPFVKYGVEGVFKSLFWNNNVRQWLY